MDGPHTLGGEQSATGQIRQIFATPIARFQHPAAHAFNDGLAETVLARANGTPDQFDYKTETLTDMAQWNEPVIDKLTVWVLTCARSMVSTALPGAIERATRAAAEGEQGAVYALSIVARSSWASVYRNGDQHPAHAHPNTAVTAIYYVSSPGKCELDLHDPRPGIDYYDPGVTFGGADQNVRISCQPGELVLFPAWLRHSVPPFAGEGERISMSWNLDFALQHS